MIMIKGMNFKKKKLLGLFIVALLLYVVGYAYINIASPRQGNLSDTIYAAAGFGVDGQNSVVYIVPNQPGDAEGRLILLLEYLNYLSAGNYVVVIAVHIEGSNLFCDRLSGGFGALGLNENLQGRFGNSYAAIIDEGQVIFEHLENNLSDITAYRTDVGGRSVAVLSAGFGAVRAMGWRTSIVIDGREYALSHQGLNIVVFDKDMGIVVDSVSFDTHDTLMFTRKTLHMENTRDFFTWNNAMRGNWTQYHSETVSAPVRRDSSEWLQHGYLIAHAMGRVDGFPGRERHTNSLEAFLQNYEAGNRFFELDLYLSSDGILFTRNARRGPFGTFEEEQSAAPYTLMTFEEVAHLMLEYDDIFIISDTKAPSNYDTIRAQFDIIWNTLNAIDSSLIYRFLVQFYTQEMYHILHEYYDFPFLIYTLYMSPDSNQEVVRFVSENDIQVVVMWDTRATRSFVEELRRAGAVVIVHFSGGDPPSLQHVYNLFVDGVYGAMLHSFTYDDFIWGPSDRWEHFQAQE